MTPKLITPATVQPVSMATALKALRVLQGDADLVSLYLAAATEKVEDYTARSLIYQTFRLDLPRWPSKKLLELRRTPLASVTHIKYYAEGSTELTTLNSADYRVCISPIPGRVEFTEGYEFPTLSERFDAVQVTFVSGYGTTENVVPSLLRAGVLMMARNYYDNRVPVGDAKIVEMPLNVRDILRSQRVESLAPLL
jgi:uncharacterized phiE125 gp8 family phage protein